MTHPARRRDPGRETLTPGGPENGVGSLVGRLYIRMRDLAGGRSGTLPATSAKPASSVATINLAIGDWSTVRAANGQE